MWLAFLLLPGQASSGSIEGVVTRLGSNEPIAGAQVGVAVPGSSALVGPRVTTDRDGKFAIQILQPGTYILNVICNGYAKYAYGERQPGAPGGTITLTQAQTLNLAVRMTPAGSVNGHIRNSNGRPIPGTTVRLVRYTYNSSGRRTFETIASARSDDRGVYRFYWVTPGRYYVVAGSGAEPLARPGTESDNPNEILENYSYTFFPGNSEIEKAVAIDVRAGAELDGIDFPLADSRLYRIRARVVDPVTGQPPPRATATISYSNLGSSTRSGGGNTYDPKTGMLEFKNLTPGPYTVGVTGYEGQQGLSNAALNRSSPAASAGVNVAVSNADVDLGVLRLELPNVITGRITGEGLPADFVSGNSVQFSFLPPDTGIPSMDLRMSAIDARPQPDGTFTANFPYPSLRVTVPLRGLPAGFYVREALLDGADALTGYARVSRTSDLQIVLSSKVAHLEGVVRDESLRLVAGLPVVLVPSVARNFSERFKQTTTDQNGRFSISDVPPGDYKVFSWEALEPYSYFDPDVLRKYEERGRLIHLAESSRETVDVTMIPEGVN